MGVKIKDFGIKIGEKYFDGADIKVWEGFEEITTEYETVQNATGNGTIVVGEHMPERAMHIIARVERSIIEQTLRYFQRTKRLVMVVGSRKINVEVEKASILRGASLHTILFLELNLVAHDPFFYDVSDFGKNIAGIIPSFGFPWTYSPDNPVHFGYREFSDKTIFENDGDSKVGVKFKIEATGDVANVKVENLRTGQFVKVNHRLKQGDILEISTVEGEKYIKLNGKDIFNEIDRLSDFFYLDIGDNFLQYSADSGATEMNVYLYYVPKYSTVEEIL